MEPEDLEWLAHFAGCLLLSYAVCYAVFMALWRAVTSSPAPPPRWKLPGDVFEDVVQTEDGGEMLVYSKGKGRTLVLLHGAGGAASHFHFLFKRLSTKDFRVAAVDMRGHGEAKGCDECSARLLAGDVQKVLDHLGGDDFTLVGYGAGGYAALAWRIYGSDARTGMVKGFVLISSFPKRPGNWTYGFFQLLVASCFLHVFLRIKFVAFRFSRALFGHACTTSMQEEWRRSFLACDPRVWELYDKATLQDLTPFLRFIGEPAMVVCGKRDIMCYDSQSALNYLGKDAGRGPRKEVLERMGHVLLWEAPDRLTNLICDFMAGNYESSVPKNKDA
mmetsp:Transcript_49671/g.121276  ORF Transcript_49671/g.121276 Transcript_49671/m.121276 type:complete len:332 (-) Transcript_49671:256-1251(-)